MSSEDSTAVMDYAPGSSDLEIIVGNTRARVSRAALCMLSPVFKAMLDKGAATWSEASKTNLNLEEDNADAFQVAFNFIHLRLEDIPRRLPLDTVYELAMLCDKYDCVQAGKQLFSCEIIREIQSSVTLPSSSDEKGIRTKWLICCHIFGWKEHLVSAATRWVETATLLDGGGIGDKASRSTSIMIPGPTQNLLQDLLILRCKMHTELRTTAYKLREKGCKGIMANISEAKACTYIMQASFMKSWHKHVHPASSTYSDQYIEDPKQSPATTAENQVAFATKDSIDTWIEHLRLMDHDSFATLLELGKSVEARRHKHCSIADYMNEVIRCRQTGLLGRVKFMFEALHGGTEPIIQVIV